MPRKTPSSVTGHVRPKIPVGMAGILAQSKVVADAFGRWGGFVVVMTSIIATTVICVVAVEATKSGIGRVFGHLGF